MKLIGIEIIGNSNYIGPSLNGSNQEVKSKVKNPNQFIQFFFMNKGDITSNWVGHSDLKELDINDLFQNETDD